MYLGQEFAKFFKHIGAVKITVIVKVQFSYQVGNTEQLQERKKKCYHPQNFI